MNWIEAEGLETADPNDKSYEAQLEDYDGMLVPGGFGKRGIEGMLKAIQYAREKQVPYFGICLGMQTACIEFARNVCGLADANSSEFDPATPHRVIYKLRELRGVEELGGTMRLGAWPCKIEPGTLAHKIYGQDEISERHRHRYEFNREYEETMVAGGLKISGSTPDGTYVEIVEIPEHPLFHRLPVPSRVQVQAARAASAVQVVHRRVLRARPEAQGPQRGGGSGNVPAAAEGRRKIRD